MFDNPRKRLDWLEDELLDDELEDILYGNAEDEEPEDEEPEEERPRHRRRDADFHRAVYEDEDDDEERICFCPGARAPDG